MLVDAIKRYGAWGRTRTGTCFTTVDFESTASTNFATQAVVSGVET